MHKFFYNKFIIFLYMFRALLCSSSGGQIILYSIWYRHSLYVRPVRSLGEHSSPNPCNPQNTKMLGAQTVPLRSTRNINAMTLSSKTLGIRHISQNAGCTTLPSNITEYPPRSHVLWTESAKYVFGRYVSNFKCEII